MTLTSDYLLYSSAGVASTNSLLATNDTINITSGTTTTTYTISDAPPFLKSIDYIVVDKHNLPLTDKVFYFLGLDAIKANTLVAYLVDSSKIDLDITHTNGITTVDTIVATTSLTGNLLSSTYYLLTINSSTNSLTVQNINQALLFYCKNVTLIGTSSVSTFSTILSNNLTITNISQASASPYYSLGLGFKIVTVDISSIQDATNIVFSGPMVTKYMIPVATSSSIIFELVPTEATKYSNFFRAQNDSGWSSQPLSTKAGIVTINNNGQTIAMEPITTFVKTPGSSSSGTDHLSVSANKAGVKIQASKDEETFVFDGPTISYIIMGVVLLLALLFIGYLLMKK